MSSTISDNRPVDPDDELLVAYLDGELDTDARDELEQRLMDEEKLRSRLQTLQSSWDLLDDLPATTSNDKLVESTLELVVSDIVSKSSIQAAHIETSRWPLVLAGCALLAAIGAFASVRWIQYQTLNQELEDLALVENLDAYLYGQDLQLMRELGANSQWNKMVGAARDVGGLAAQRQSLVSNVPVGERSQAISDLDLEERAFLETQSDRFRRMELSYRHSIRKTSAAVAAQPDPDLLLATMSSYAVWRDTLPDDLRDRIEKGTGEQRQQAIDEAIGRTLSQIRRQSRKSLDEGTTQLIYTALEHFLDQRLAANSEMADSVQEIGRQFGNPEMGRRFAIRRMLGEISRPGGRGPTFSGPIESIPEITDQELWSIIDVLQASSGEHAKALEMLETVTDLGSFIDQEQQILATLTEWAFEAFERSSPASDRDDRTLVQRYKELDPKVRDTLDLLPPERMKAELDRMTDPRRFPGPFRRRPSGR